jgi:hypothetical protein
MSPHLGFTSASAFSSASAANASHLCASRRCTLLVPNGRSCSPREDHPFKTSSRKLSNLLLVARGSALSRAAEDRIWTYQMGRQRSTIVSCAHCAASMPYSLPMVFEFSHRGVSSRLPFHTSLASTGAFLASATAALCDCCIQFTRL